MTITIFFFKCGQSVCLSGLWLVLCQVLSFVFVMSRLCNAQRCDQVQGLFCQGLSVRLFCIVFVVSMICCVQHQFNQELNITHLVFVQSGVCVYDVQVLLWMLFLAGLCHIWYLSFLVFVIYYFYLSRVYFRVCMYVLGLLKHPKSTLNSLV